MKNYDPNITYGKHVIKVTLQQWEYVGHLWAEVMGNCKGTEVLYVDFEVDAEDFVSKNDCDFKYLPETNLCIFNLKDEHGNILECLESSWDVNDFVVSVEIQDFGRVKNE